MGQIGSPAMGGVFPGDDWWLGGMAVTTFLSVSAQPVLHQVFSIKSTSPQCVTLTNCEVKVHPSMIFIFSAQSV